MERKPVREAVGMILCHDVTQIIPGEVKGRAFKKGHTITQEDIPVLLSLGKDNIYVWENDETMTHENDAAEVLREIAAGEGLEFTEVREGKINFIASEDGLLKINKEMLFKLNCYDDIVLTTFHNNAPVKKGDIVAGTRIVPLVIKTEKLDEVRKNINDKIVSIKPFNKMKVAVVTTGSEVFHGRIKDAFGPVIREKFQEYGSEVINQVKVPDDEEKIVQAVNDGLKSEADIVVCTGGMSVDPDDLTPSAIRECASEVIKYGAPVLPGSMLLVAYSGKKVILGLPGCVMYFKRSVFDLVLPRILAREKIEKMDIIKLAHGGLCMRCDVCVYPKCSFGKGE
ncbi:molybdopterin-binding protein [Oceanirhabdus seepicola]|uniref:Molybdopterin molybdenumtransferase n=1 Tax=Oceanirhabdus seepicola TaxID=2828781 RepID=A0A9J6P7Z5_9CLOT|nr:molybdopterin-binding protein [Oceanirhabdus seepicola]MCM1992118.1 molybdopterin-binding protein [Oceanirhabdus seepicola]